MSQAILSTVLVALAVGWLGWRIWGWARRRARPAACAGCGGGCHARAPARTRPGRSPGPPS